MSETKFSIELRILRGISCLSCRDASRYVLSGVCVKLEKKDMRIIATNGKCLAMYRVQAPFPEERSINLPTFWLPYIRGKQSEYAHFTCNENKFEVESGDKCFKGKLIDGDFPKLDSTIPKDSTVPISSFAFDLELASDFVRCLKIINPKRSCAVVIRQHKDNLGAISILSDSDPNFYGIQMPYRNQTETIPDWVNK